MPHREHGQRTLQEARDWTLLGPSAEPECVGDHRRLKLVSRASSFSQGSLPTNLQINSLTASQPSLLTVCCRGKRQYQETWTLKTRNSDPVWIFLWECVTDQDVCRNSMYVGLHQCSSFWLVDSSVRYFLYYWIQSGRLHYVMEIITWDVWWDDEKLSDYVKIEVWWK